MQSTQKIKLWKKISIVPFLFTCVPIVFIYLFLRDIPVLNSLFVNYVNSGTSLFFPLLPHSIIVFDFSTSHLIDIIIIINIIGSIERIGYHYYMNAYLKVDYLEVYPELLFFETNETQEELTLNSNLILGMKKNSWPFVNDDFSENPLYQKSRIRVNNLNSKSGYHRNLFKIKHCIFNLLYDSNNKFFLPSKIYDLFSYSFENYHQKEGL